MKPLSIVLLIAEAAAASALAAAVTAFAIRQGAGPWIIHPALALVFVVVAGVLLWMGIQVRRFRAHKQPGLMPYQLSELQCSLVRVRLAE